MGIFSGMGERLIRATVDAATAKTTETDWETPYVEAMGLAGIIWGTNTGTLFGSRVRDCDRCFSVWRGAVKAGDPDPPQPRKTSPGGNLCDRCGP